MTQEEIQKLAEEECNEHYTCSTANAFIKGYTTCQNTEVAELKKELERVKGLLESAVVGYLPEAPANRIWSEYCQQHNL